MYVESIVESIIRNEAIDYLFIVIVNLFKS